MSKAEKLTYSSGNVYTDYRGCTYLADFRRNIVFQVDDKYNILVKLLSGRYIIFLMIVTWAGFYFDWAIALIGCSILLLATDIYYHLFFMKKLRPARNVKMPIKMNKVQQFAQDSKTNNIIRLVVCSIVGLFLILVDIVKLKNPSDFEGIMDIIFFGGVTVLSLYIAIVSAIVVKNYDQLHED